MTVVIYEWGTRPDFLLRQLYPRARVVNATPLADGDLMVRAARGHARSPGLWLFHLNLSRSEHWLPGRREVIGRLGDSGWRVVNGHVVDTRKATVQRLNRELGLGDVSVTRDDDPGMKVIVKTDYNYGGAGEARLSAAVAERLGVCPIAGCPIRSFDQYVVCRLGDVDETVWTDARLVVERYVENDRNLFCRFYRCGSRSVLSEVVNAAVIKKMEPGLPRRNWCFGYGEDGPGAHRTAVLRATQMCEALRLEFGALDVVLDRDGRPYVIDVNPTPGWGKETQGEIIEFLRGGF